MARCEDFPCCGHEAGCCPDFDKSGKQLNMVCICGAKLPINNRYSICNTCLRRGSEEDGEMMDCDMHDFDDDEEEGTAGINEDYPDDQDFIQEEP